MSQIDNITQSRKNKYLTERERYKIEAYLAEKNMDIGKWIV